MHAIRDSAINASSNSYSRHRTASRRHREKVSHVLLRKTIGRVRKMAFVEMGAGVPRLQGIDDERADVTRFALRTKNE